MYSQKFKDFVEEWFNKLIKCGLFDNYDFEFVYLEKDESHDYDVDVLTKMSVKVMTDYLTIKVFIYPEAERKYMELDKKTFIQRYIVHELCHSRTTPIAELARERNCNEREIIYAEEQLTERYAKLVNYYLEKEKLIIN